MPQHRKLEGKKNDRNNPGIWRGEKFRAVKKHLPHAEFTNGLQGGSTGEESKIEEN